MPAPAPVVPGVLRVDGETEPGWVVGVPRPEPLGVVVPLVTPWTPVPAPVSVAAPELPGVAVVSFNPAPELPGVAYGEPVAPVEPGAPRLLPEPLVPEPLIPVPLAPEPVPA